jgi:hypothetical protein
VRSGRARARALEDRLDGRGRHVARGLRSGARVAQRRLLGASARQQAEQEEDAEREGCGEQDTRERAGHAVVQEERSEPGADRETGERSEPAAHARGLRRSGAGAGGRLLLCGRVRRRLLLLGRRARRGLIRIDGFALLADALAAAHAARIHIDRDEREADKGYKNAQ